MSIEPKEYNKIDIAFKMLETALKLFFAGDDYFSVIHLAGACDEIIGKYLKDEGKENSFESLRNSTKYFFEKVLNKNINDKEAGDIWNKVKNAIKHKNGVNDNVVLMDPKDDARALLERAIENWWRLKSDLTGSMKKFWAELYH